MNKDKQMIEIWGDIVEIKSLIKSIIISGATTMGGYFLAQPNNRTKQLFFGLLGAVFGFTITAFIIKPKRVIIVEEESKKR